jgi:hypothetical protein
MGLTLESGFDNRGTQGNGADYSGRMYWVVALGGDKVVVRLDENHFARKHLMLTSVDQTKMDGLFDEWSLTDWVNWAVFGSEPKVDEYAETKAKNRVEHRANVAPFDAGAGAVAPIGTPTPVGPVTADRQRWSSKYRGNPLNPPAVPFGPAPLPVHGPALPVGAPGGEQGSRNSVVNLIDRSKNSINRKDAAVAFAEALNALPAPVGMAGPGGAAMVHNHGHVDVDFGRQCVINTQFTRQHNVASITGTSNGIRIGVNETVRNTPNKRSFSVYHLVGTL